MEENNQISKSNRIKIIVITALIFLVSIAGISYAYFTIQITGNDTASSMRLRTANMQLVYNDVQIISGEYAIPGWSDDKTLTVTNTGNVTAYYTIIWRDLINEVTNNELVISAECSASSGSCADLDETIVPTSVNEIHNVAVQGNIEIAPGVTHTYTLTAEFIETGSNQNYNQNKYFNGTLNITDGFEPVIRSNGTDSTTGVSLVKIGTEEFYVLNDALNYPSLIESAGGTNQYGYASGKTILLAKYSLYVGRSCTSGLVCELLSTSDSGYGLQSVDARGYESSLTSYIGIVPFSGLTNNIGYWYDPSTEGVKTQYAAYSNNPGSPANNIYDTNYISAPKWALSYTRNESENYSVAYYVEEYVRRLGINGTGRLLTFVEAYSFAEGQKSIVLNNSSYWLGSAFSSNTVGSPATDRVYSVDTYWASNNVTAIDNSAATAVYYYGVRPVIVVNTSDIQSS